MTPADDIWARWICAVLLATLGYIIALLIIFN